MRLKIITNNAVEFGVNEGDTLKADNIEILNVENEYMIVVQPQDICLFKDEVIALDFNLDKIIENYERERIINYIIN
jgi:hypothetical protein